MKYMGEHVRCFADEGRWADSVVRQYQVCGNTSTIIISDVDDTILDTNARWYGWYISHLNERGERAQNDHLPTSAEFKKLGPRHFLQELVPDYDALKAQLINSSLFHEDFDGVETLQWLIAISIHSGVPHGYISTRPYALGAVTCANLDKHMLSPSPLLLRGDHIPYSETIRYKINALQTLCAAMERTDLPITQVHFVDDYAQLVELVNQLGLDNIYGTVFAENNSWKDILARLGMFVEQKDEIQKRKEKDDR